MRTFEADFENDGENGRKREGEGKIKSMVPREKTVRQYQNDEAVNVLAEEIAAKGAQAAGIFTHPPAQSYCCTVSPEVR